MSMMTNDHSRTVVTESSQETDSIRIWSTIKLEQGPPFVVESLWKRKPKTMRLLRERLAVRIGDLTLPIQHGPAMAEHVEIARRAFPELMYDDSSQEERIILQDSVKTVYLATKPEESEVFLDPISAAFWAADRSEVKEISVDTAAFVLKADRASVIESAIQASKNCWQVMNVVTAIISMAEELKKQMNDMGISSAELGVEPERGLRNLE